MAVSPPSSSQEPTVLDWFLSLLRLRPLPIPSGPEPAHAFPAPQEAPAPATTRTLALQWARLRLPIAFVAALLGQAILSTATRRDLVPITGVFLFALSAALVVWAMWRRDLGLISPPATETTSRDLPVRGVWLAAGAVLALFAFLASGGNSFRVSTVVFWTGSMAALVVAFWDGENPSWRAVRWIRSWIEHPRISFSLDGWALAFWVVLGTAAFFRFAYLSTVPLDMWSDQAEKLLDVADVLAGRNSIFFLRNTGREPLQFYMAAATARLFATGISFLTLKIGTALAGWLTLPFIYGFARELADRRVGLAAMALAGVAIWPNVISRAGLRFPLYAVFAAAALYLLARGLRRQNRNEILLAGLVSGLGLMGYSPARMVPLILAFGVLVYMLHPAARGRHARLFTWSLGAALLGLVAFLPLLRVALEEPDNFLFRSLSRLGTAERPLPGPPLEILASNLARGLGMFNWNSGQIWVVSIAGRPLLDWVTGALFVIGVALALVRYARRRHWLDVFTLAAIPLLMAPSILSLAFPAENPAPNRGSGAMVPVFALAGWALVAVVDSVRAAAPGRWGRAIAVGWAALLLVWTGVNNYTLTFDVFYPAYRQSAWNTSEGGQVIRAYAESIGDYESAYVIPYPFWWDTRLVGIQAGQPLRDYALPRDGLDALAFDPGPLLFLFNREDAETAARLQGLFPGGQLSTHPSAVANHDFMVYFVPQRAEIR